MDFILCLLLLDDRLKAVSPCGIRVQNVVAAEAGAYSSLSRVYTTDKHNVFSWVR